MPTHRSVKGFIVSFKELEQAIAELERLAFLGEDIMGKATMCQILTHRLLTTNAIGFVEDNDE